MQAQLKWSSCPAQEVRVSKKTGLFPLLRSLLVSARIAVSIGTAGTTAASSTCLFTVKLWARMLPLNHSGKRQWDTNPWRLIESDFLHQFSASEENGIDSTKLPMGFV